MAVNETLQARVTAELKTDAEAIFAAMGLKTTETIAWQATYVNHRECHIEPDWLLIYRVNQEKKRIELVRTGSHSELFG